MYMYRYTVGKYSAHLLSLLTSKKPSIGSCCKNHVIPLSMNTLGYIIPHRTGGGNVVITAIEPVGLWWLYARTSWAAAGGAVVNNLVAVGGQQMNNVALSGGACVAAMVISFVKER